MSTSTDSAEHWEEQLQTAQAVRLRHEACLLEQQLLRELLDKEPRKLTLGEISNQSLSVAVKTMEHWRRCGPQNVWLELNSTTSSGSITDCLALYDYLNWYRSLGHRISIIAKGPCSTHAAIILQAADENQRFMSPGGWLCLSEEKFGGEKTTSSDIGDIRELHTTLQTYSTNALLGRTSGQLDPSKFASETERERLWWVSADDAGSFGLVDHVFLPGPPAFSQTFDDCVPDDPSDSPKIRVLKAQVWVELLKDKLSQLRLDDELAKANPAILLFAKVDEGSCLTPMRAFDQFERTQPVGATVDFFINTPGGDVLAGMELVRTMLRVLDSGRYIRSIAIGRAASMGGPILQAGSERLIGAHTIILIHRIQTMVQGSISKVADTDRVMKALETQVMPILAGKSRLSEAKIMELCDRKDWWLFPQQVIAKKFADRYLIQKVKK